MSAYKIDLQYFGSIKYYYSLINQTNIVFCTDVWLDKTLHLNRTELIGANGPLLLTVPLVGGRDKKQKLKDTLVSFSEPWQRIHWKGIHDSYRKAPWFEDYAPGLEQLIKGKEKFLVDLNLKTMDWVLSRLKLNIDILAENGKRELLTEQASAPKMEQGSAVIFPPYQQVFAERHGFIPNLSILDLLLCEGPSAKKYLQNGNLF